MWHVGAFRRPVSFVYISELLSAAEEAYRDTNAR